MADEQPHDESQQRAGTSKLRRLKYSLGSSSSLTEPETDKEASSNVVCPPTALGDTNLEVQADAITAMVVHVGDTSGGTSGPDSTLGRVIETTASPAIATCSAVPPAISAESLTMSLSSGSPSEPARMTSGDYGYIHEMASSSSEWSSGAVRRSFAVYGSRLPSPMPLCQPPLQSQTLSLVQDQAGVELTDANDDSGPSVPMPMVLYRPGSRLDSSVSRSSGSPSPAWWERLRAQQEQRRLMVQEAMEAQLEAQRASEVAAAISAEHLSAQWQINRFRLQRDGAGDRQQQQAKRSRSKQRSCKLALLTSNPTGMQLFCR